jgi:hypothetical protein
MLALELYVYYKFGRAAGNENHNHQSTPPTKSHCHSEGVIATSNHEADSSPADSNPHSCHGMDMEKTTTKSSGDAEKAMPHCHHSSSRPMWATVLVGVSHCGAGCVLGDIVGEWLVYGTNATINGQMIWPALLIDYAFALLFGIALQYFSIAPMSGEYGPKTVWRALKADILSLTSFEVGAFGWMIIYQVAIFDYHLEMTTWLYWW